MNSLGLVFDDKEEHPFKGVVGGITQCHIHMNLGVLLFLDENNMYKSLVRRHGPCECLCDPR